MHPCREGTYWLDKVMDRILAGKASVKDIETVNDVAGNMQGMTLCALGDFAANPILATVDHFREEFEAYAAMQSIEAAEETDAEGDPTVMEAPSEGKRRAEAAAGD
jgi:hypothetical protein